MIDFREVISNLGWVCLWLGFLVSIYFLIHDRRSLLTTIKTGDNKERKAALVRLRLLYVSSIVTFVGALGSQWASEKTDAKIDKQERQISAQSNQLAQATAKVIGLEEMARHRTITPRQKSDFINLLSTAPKGQVKIGATNPNEEMRFFRQEIVEVVRDAGYPIQSYMDYSSQLNVKIDSSVAVLVNGVGATKLASEIAMFLASAFQQVGIKATLVKFTQNNPDGDIGIETNEVMILVFDKK